MVIIYGLKCNISNMLYIGSTKQKLKQRLYQHKWDSKNRGDNCRSKKIIDNNDYIIYEIERCDENIREEREQYWIDNTDNINFQNVKGCDLYKYSYSSDYHKWQHKKHYKNNKDKYITYANKIKNYHKTWGDPISNLHRDCPNNLLLIDVNLFR